VTHEFNTRSTFDEGTYLGTTAAGSNLSPGCAEGQLCWNGSAVPLSTPYIWVPWTGVGGVLRYNTDTGAEAGPFPIGVVPNWPSSAGAAYGFSPSRTSVNAFDQTVWVADRGFSADYSAVYRSSVAHLDSNGHMLCFADVPGVARALATDALGNAWVGSFYNGYMVQFSGTEFEPGSASPPRCKTLRYVPVQGTPYGAAADNNNSIWVQGWSYITAIDANTGTIAAVYGPGCAPYGITVDRDYVWLGCYASEGISRITKATGAVNFVYTGGNPRGIASSRDGYVYAADNANHIIRMNRVTMAFSRITIPTLWQAQMIQGVAVDNADRVWAIDYYGLLTRMNGDGSNQVTFGSPGRSFYTYTDLTGQQTINAGLTPGLWTVVYDSNYIATRKARWMRLTLDVTKPSNSTISARVKVANTVAGLSSVPWWNGQAVPGVTRAEEFRLENNGLIPLDDIALPRGRYIQIQVKLTTTRDSVTPVVRSLSVTWSP